MKKLSFNLKQISFVKQLYLHYKSVFRNLQNSICCARLHLTLTTILTTNSWRRRIGFHNNHNLHQTSVLQIIIEPQNKHLPLFTRDTQYVQKICFLNSICCARLHITLTNVKWRILWQTVSCKYATAMCFKTSNTLFGLYVGILSLFMWKANNTFNAETLRVELTV